MEFISNVTENCSKRELKIGQGGYGVIFVYSSGTEDVVVKVEELHSTVPIEKEISEALNKSPCDTIRRVRHVGNITGPINSFFIDRAYHTSAYSVYVMDKMTGDLTKIVNRYQTRRDGFQKYLEMVEKVRSQVMCLAKKGYYYTDLKPQNVMFCDEGNDKITVLLGDLGSAVRDKDNQCCATYPPPEHTRGRGFFKITKKITTCRNCHG